MFHDYRCPQNHNSVDFPSKHHRMGLFLQMSEELEVTAQLICAFVFTYAKGRFSNDVAQMCIPYINSLSTSVIC